MTRFSPISIWYQSAVVCMKIRAYNHGIRPSLQYHDCFQVLLVHKASKGSFSRVFDFEANDLAGEDSDSRTR